MIKARLETFVPSEMRRRIGMGSLNGRDVWDALARRRMLPRINGRIPYTSEPIGWGWLADGIFLITAISKTRMGFSCEITLYPKQDREATPFRDAALIDWIAANLFRDKIKEPQNASPPVSGRYVFDGENGMYFCLGNLMQV